MAITFPSSPAVNDQFVNSGRTWIWTGEYWRAYTQALSNATVNTAILAANSVTSEKIVDGTIVAGDIASNAVTTVKILDANVTAAKIANETITATQIANATITATQIASDAVTQAKIADRAVGSTELANLTLNAQTGTTYTLALTDAQKLVTLNNASAISLTVPTNATAAFTIGDQVNLLQLGAGQVTVSGAGVTFRSEGSKLKLKAQYAIATLIKVGTDEWVVVGNLSA